MPTQTSHKNLAEALVAFQREMPIVGKDATNPHFGSKFASLAQITREVTPILANHGLSFTVTPRVTPNGGYEAVGALMHTSGETIDGALPLYGQNAQQIGSSLTYARRYLLSAMTGVVTDDDDDGTLAAQNAQRTAAAKDWRPVLAELPNVTDLTVLGDMWRREGVGNAPAEVRQAFTDRGDEIKATSEASEHTDATE